MHRCEDNCSRECKICIKPIEKFEWMLDLFREESARGGHQVAWVHVACARKALQAWILKKEAQSESANTGVAALGAD